MQQGEARDFDDRPFCRFRPAELNDLGQILEFDEFAGDRQREIELGHCYVAHIDAEVIGYASVEPRGLLGQAFLTYLCVPKKHRGKGVATGLIRVVQGRAVGRKLLSSTEQWCVQMQHIFGKLGWTRVGEIRGVNRDGSTEWFYAYDIPVRDSNPGA